MAIKIVHPKIASLKPTWSPFAGWSSIFMPFGTTDAENDLFARLRTAFEGRAQAQWSEDHYLCPLPPDTYHVSFCDLINQGNMKSLAGEGPGVDSPFQLSAEPPQWLLQAIQDAGLPGDDIMRHPIEFAFSHVATSHGRMLGVMLEPTGTGFEALLKARGKLQQSLYEACRIPPSAYAPHVTLGYFPNQDVGNRADRDAVPAFQKEMEEALTGSVARFHAIGLYAFTDMISYKLSRKLCPV